MILYFLRHGQAGSREEWEGDDAERPLTNKGKKSMDREAEAMLQLDLRLEAVVSSPLVRAFQTAEIVARKMEMEVVEDARLSPGFDTEKLAEVIAGYKEAEAIMLVGHEPDFSQTIGELIGSGRVVCKKGGLARVDLLPDSPALAGELVWLLPPKILTGL